MKSCIMRPSASFIFIWLLFGILIALGCVTHEQPMEQITNVGQTETYLLARPNTHYHPTRYLVTSGAVGFAGYQGSNIISRNVMSRVNKEYFAMAPQGASHQVTFFATSAITHFTHPIGIVIMHDNDILIDRILSNSRYATYTIPPNRTGVQHQIQYSCVLPMVWELKFIYWHWGDIPLEQCPDGNVTLKDNYALIDDKVYAHPTDSRSVNANFNKLTSYSTLNDLIFHEFYDDKIGFVNVARHYVAGDTILIRDTILSTEYNRSEDYTTFVFYPHERLHFSGNLTRNYLPGDVICLRFKLLPVPNSDVFVELDYVRQGRTNGIPNINRYLNNSNK